LDSDVLSDEWADVTAKVDGVSESPIVDIRFLRSACGNEETAAGYITSYLTKSPDLWDGSQSGSLNVQERAERLFEYHDAFHGANMVQPFGIFHHSSDDVVSLSWVPDDDSFSCPECGSDDWSVSGRVCVEGNRYYLWEIALGSGPGPPHSF
jgi:hypothetical protein